MHGANLQAIQIGAACLCDCFQLCAANKDLLIIVLFVFGLSSLPDTD